MLKSLCTVRGDRQIPDLHYHPDDISSPVADRNAIRAALSLGTSQNLLAEHCGL